MRLHLDYTCTESDLKEALSLNLHRQYGGGPKWRARLLYYSVSAVFVAMLFWCFKADLTPKERPWFFAVIILIFVALYIFKRMTRQTQDAAVQLEISERELAFTGGDGCTILAWSAFCKCMESPSLFVLLSNSKRLLYVVPKRAFPDEKAQGWFLSLACQMESVAAPSARDEFVSGRPGNRGIALTVRLEYRDYLVRVFSSWRMKGLAIGILALAAGTSLFAPDTPGAVHSRGETLLFMLVTMIPMLIVMFAVAAFFLSFSNRKNRKPQQLELTGEGVGFANRDASGFLAWTTYKYYLENRWAFFVWNSRGSLWLMLPKRQFGSLSDIEECRDLLRIKLKSSRWFFQ
jgi:hypothetical protein